MTMKCIECGLPSRIFYLNPERQVTTSMREVRRVRKCPEGHKWPTTEIDQVTLGELRRRAFLYDMEAVVK
jgi:hypothetical protein